MQKSPVAGSPRVTRRRSLRRAGPATLVVGLALLLPACAASNAGSTPEPETSAARVAGETTTAQTAGPDPGTNKRIAETGTTSEQATATYTVPSITCPSCAARVEANAEKDPGVLDVQVDGQRVTVGYDPSKTDPTKVAQSIIDGGDTVVPDG